MLVKNEFLDMFVVHGLDELDVLPEAIEYNIPILEVSLSVPIPKVSSLKRAKKLTPKRAPKKAEGGTERVEKEVILTLKKNLRFS